MSEELDVLREVAQRLNQAKIAYAVSGSIAANCYTIPRMTRDLDVVIEMGEPDIDRFIRLFQGDFFVDREMIIEEVRKRGMFNLIHAKYVFKIDFILRKDSAWQKSLFLRRQKVHVEKIPIWVVSIEDLIIAKLLWAKGNNSELQLNDARNLLKSDYPKDHAYVMQYVQDLELGEPYQKVKQWMTRMKQ